MNHSTSYRIGAVLSTMLLVGAFPSAILAQQAKDNTVESQIFANARLGEVILQEDFSKIENGGMPEGWIKNHPFNFLWAADKATGLSGDVVSVQNHKFAIRSDKGAHIIALPPLCTENYVFSATFQFVGRGGSFGLETDIADDYVNCNYATNSMMYPYEVKEGEFAQFVRKQGNGDIGRQNIDCSTGYFAGPLPDLNTDVVFTVYHLEGVSYFYCNGKFVSQLADRKRETDAPRTRIGMYSCGGSFLVSSVTVRKLLPKTLLERGLTTALTMGKPYIECDGDACTLLVPVTLDKTDKNLNDGVLSSPLLLVHLGDLLEDAKLTARYHESSTISQDDKTKIELLKFPNLRGDDLSRTYVVRAFLSYTSVGWPVLYSTKQWRINPVMIANKNYNQLNDTQKRNMDTVFKNVKGYQGPNVKQLTFAVFSDFHYKKGMYASPVAGMQAIVDRAAQANVAFMIHGGDFCNDYKGSPELMNAYLNNNRNLPAYGVYGNHELESRGNVMPLVTPRLTNQADNVVWATEDGKIGDGFIAHYYFESNGFRIICLDTNYSWNPTTKEWQHNTEASYGPPKGNSSGNSLGPKQLEWLENILMDAADKEIPCLVFSHVGYSAEWSSAPDTKKVREIFKKANASRLGTVLMAINGHLHTNHVKVIDNILFFDVNTVYNGDWQGGQKEQHYADGMTYDFVDYDQDGKPTGSRKRNLTELGQAKNTWFFTDPLSAIVTIDSLGHIVIDGSKTTWRYNVIPSNDGHNGCEPFITSGTYDILE
ncbi:MAG: metallophosphoesterase [Victivallales bacterium]|nr:metallophosphoesterase [Victivallales bacterium]